MAKNFFFIIIIGLICIAGNAYSQMTVIRGSGGSGDMTEAVWDGDSDGYIDPDAGGTGADLSGATGVPYFTNGVAALNTDITAEELSYIATLSSDAQTQISAKEPADATILKEEDVDDTPVSGITLAPVSSNWAATKGVANWPSLSDSEAMCLTAEPGSPVTGKVYCFDGASADPAGLGISTNYLTVYDGASYIPLVDEDFNLYLSSISLPTSLSSELSGTTTPHLLTEAELQNNVITDSGETVAQHYDFPVASEGWNAIFAHVESGVTVTLDPNGSEIWYFKDGNDTAWTTLTAGQNIVSTAGTAPAFLAIWSVQWTSGVSVYVKADNTDWGGE